jgi:predicted ATPase/DNA-binding SARP family transcriptional activator
VTGGTGLEGRVEFRILGPLEVLSDGQALDLGGAKQRALLAMLLLNANEVVSTDRLIDALWDENPPESAQKALQVHVSNLRKVLGKERLQTKTPGYLLRAEEHELDVKRFSELRASGQLDEALALWRGPPLADLGYQRFAQGEIARLEELRLACLEERLQRDLAHGRHAELTGELEALAAENPLRERLRGQLMLALYRSGRQAEALEVFQQARNSLVEELGIEPGRELRELHQAILNQAPALELPQEVRSGQPEEEPVRAEAEPAEEPFDREVRKTITALFVDVRIVSVQQGGLDPEALRRLTGRALELVGAAVERHGGSFETLAGSAMMVVFGLPAVHEDDPVRAVRAACDVRHRLSELAAELHADSVCELDSRIGIGTGEVVAGGGIDGIGAIGEPLNRSAALAQAAEPGAVVIDGPTRRLLGERIVAEAAGEAWRLVELSDDGAPPSSRLASPMIGRQRERRRLRDAFDQAQGDRSCQLFTVLGQAGVGKSRLVQEFLAGVEEQALVARGRCLPYGEGITFWPLLETLKDAVDFGEGDSPETVRQKLRSALGGVPDADLAARQVAELIGFGDTDGGTSGGGEWLAPARALFEALARERPLVLVFDDIHWAEATFLDLIEHLADSLRDSPVLLVCLARPELLDVRRGWGGGKVNATTVLLEPLSEEECAQLIHNLVGGADVAEEVAGRIAEGAEGNPLFVEEMLSMLIDDGLLVRRNGQWCATTELASVPVPPTIQALLAARLDQLGPEERTVIERAAVEGKVFHEGAIAELAPASLRPSVGAHLQELVRKELVRPHRPDFATERAFRFRHLMIRDAAYESLPKTTRARLHEAFARWLEERAGERTTGYEEIIGYHLEQAFGYQAELGPVDATARGLAREAADRLGAAGRRAFIRSDAPAGVNLVSRAVALLPPEDPFRVELVPTVRVVQGTDMSWAEHVLTEAIETAERTGDSRLAAHALVQRGFLRLFTEQDVKAEEILDTAERGIAAFEELQDELGLARGWRLKAQAHYLGRCAKLSAEASERALAHARRAGDRFEQREIEEWLVIALVWGPVPVAEAVTRCRRLLAGCAGERERESLVLGALALLTTMAGAHDESCDLAERARRMLDDLGDGIWIVSFQLAEASLWRGDAAGAETELRPFYGRLKRIGEKSHFSAMAQLLAEAVYRQGRLDEAEQITLECERAARANDVHDQIRWRAVRAKIFARRGESQAAEALAREAIALAREGDFVVARAGALMDLVEILDLAGHPDGALAAAQEAARFHDLKGSVPTAARVPVDLASIDQG